MSRETRKCGTCGQPIIVNRQTIDKIAYYQGMHHHVDCLVNKANEGIQSGKRINIYQRLLNRIPELMAESKKRLEYTIIQDEFNTYLLDHYDVFEVSKRFWNIVNDIAKGNYKSKKCNPVDMDTIFHTWQWGQKNLDNIAAVNKANHKGPQNDDQRLNYDLAIVMKHVVEYKKFIAKLELAKNEMETNTSYDDIDISRIGKAPSTKKRDLSDIADDIL